MNISSCWTYLLQNIANKFQLISTIGQHYVVIPNKFIKTYSVRCSLSWYNTTEISSVNTLLGYMFLYQQAWEIMLKCFVLWICPFNTYAFLKLPQKYTNIQTQIRLAEMVSVQYNDVIMGVMASQITSLTIVYATIYLGADQTKHQSSASLAFVRGIHRRPVNSLHKWPVTRKVFPFDDIIMPGWHYKWHYVIHWHDTTWDIISHSMFADTHTGIYT